jgi:hypothetical protein
VAVKVVLGEHTTYAGLYGRRCIIAAAIGAAYHEDLLGSQSSGKNERHFQDAVERDEQPWCRVIKSLS